MVSSFLQEHHVDVFLAHSLIISSLPLIALQLKSPTRIKAGNNLCCECRSCDNATRSGECAEKKYLMESVERKPWLEDFPISHTEGPSKVTVIVLIIAHSLQ